MRVVLFSLLTLCAYSSYAQPSSGKNRYKIPDFAVLYDIDSIKFYLDADGLIVEARCAAFIRRGRLHPTLINVQGTFYDYDMRGSLIFRATMHDNKLDGPATYFRPDGSVRETGAFQKNKRHGRWSHFYPNGVVEKILIYEFGEPLLWEARNRKGKLSVAKGFGHYKAEIEMENEEYYYIARGAVRDGKKEGPWELVDPASRRTVLVEEYFQGNLVNGLTANGEEYTTHSQINFEKFSPHEIVTITANRQLCHRRYVNGAGYQNQYYFETFYPELTNLLTDHFPTPVAQWVMVTFEINNADKIQNIIVYSSIGDKQVEDFIRDYLKETYAWEQARAGGEKVPTSLFFTILFTKNNIVIPAYVIYQLLEQKIFYNSNNEITVAELSNHYRTAQLSNFGFVYKTEEFDRNGKKYMEVNYDQKGKKEGKFLYNRYGLKIASTFSNDMPNDPIPDSILSGIEQKEKFLQAKYIRKRDYPKLRYFLDSPQQENGQRKKVEEEQVYTLADSMPDFPGGLQAVHEFIRHHLVIPEKAKAANIKGMIKVEFTVYPDGAVSNVVVISGLGYGCDEAVAEAVSMLPDWQPGIHEGKPVHVRLHVDIPFPL